MQPNDQLSELPGLFSAPSDQLHQTSTVRPARQSSAVRPAPSDQHHQTRPVRPAPSDQRLVLRWPCRHLGPQISRNSTHIQRSGRRRRPGDGAAGRRLQRRSGRRWTDGSGVASALFKAAVSGCSHMIPVSPSECGRALEMETSRDQDGNCSEEGKTSKHLFLRMSPRSQKCDLHIA